MMNRKRLWVQICLCSLLSVCLVLQLSFSAPNVYAAVYDPEFYKDISYPSDYTTEGTDQTGIPYSALVTSMDTTVNSASNLGIDSSQTALRCSGAVQLQKSSNVSFDLILAESIQLKPGYRYTFYTWCFQQCRDTSWNSVPSEKVSIGLEIAGVAAKVKTVSYNSKVVYEWEFNCTELMYVDRITIFTVNSSATYHNLWFGWLRCLVRDMDGEIISAIDNGTSDLKQQISDSQAALQQSIDNQTSAIVDATEQQTSAIGGFFSNLFSSISALILPSQEYFSSFFSEFNDWMKEHFGALYYPIALIIDILERLAALPVSDQPSITLPGVTIQGEKLWDETTYTFDFSDGLGLSNLYQLYLTVVDCIIAIALVNLAKHKMEQIEKGT